ncbi:PPOX class F420-dependent oxidoreductase [Yinghuangia sp. ASG 101]|uniref:PPOX class F420-dependent oxidoreductase n=1 Tax=Yinghuangia sp. ASG 101 TaxID=2896848 RepID=UPI001E34B892|nr:PPOX class F420-dependent oxidoreductase [Yinghuangia sp. ASG 101]UGQ14019.1 PPOX class F420-dependent oxidoreductase [Yinghuangia sp. ASG 101]
MSTEEWHNFVTRDGRTGKFATVGPGGTPHITPVWFVLDGDDFLFTTGVGTAKARNLRDNPQAAICVEDDAPPFSYVEARGEVTLSDNLDEVVAVATRAGSRYMGPEQGEEFGRRNGVPGEVVVRLRPRKIVAFSGIAD